MNEQPEFPAPDVSAASEPLPVVIAFDEPAAYYRAVRLLARTARRLCRALDLQPLPWSFGALASPAWHPLATADTVRAPIIVVSTTRSGPLPARVRDWLRDSCRALPDRPALLVALIGAPGADPAGGGSPLHFLRETARGAGMSFLAPRAAAIHAVAHSNPAAALVS